MEGGAMKMSHILDESIPEFKENTIFTKHFRYLK